MKELKLILCLCVFALGANAQSFYKKAFVVDVNTGIEILDTKATIEQKNSSFDTTYTATGKTANKNFSFGGEFGLLKNLGVGARVKLNNYFTDQDTATKTKPEGKSTDIMAFLNYHLVNKKRINLLAGASAGYSSFKYMANNTAGDMITSAGPYLDLHSTLQIFIKRFAFEVGLSVPYIIYGDFETNNSAYNTNNTTRGVAFMGYCINGGIAWRFGKNPDDK